jgi:hypothetical protein
MCLSVGTGRKTARSFLIRRPLKVVGNEKLGGFKFLQLLGIDLGPWRSMSIFILNVPFAVEKHISVSALSSKMNRRFVCN